MKLRKLWCLAPVTLRNIACLKRTQRGEAPACAITFLISHMQNSSPLTFLPRVITSWRVCVTRLGKISAGIGYRARNIPVKRLSRMVSRQPPQILLRIRRNVNRHRLPLADEPARMTILPPHYVAALRHLEVKAFREITPHIPHDSIADLDVYASRNCVDWKHSREIFAVNPLPGVIIVHRASEPVSS